MIPGDLVVLVVRRPRRITVTTRLMIECVAYFELPSDDGLLHQLESFVDGSIWKLLYTDLLLQCQCSGPLRLWLRRLRQMALVRGSVRNVLSIPELES